MPIQDHQKIYLIQPVPSGPGCGLEERNSWGAGGINPWQSVLSVLGGLKSLYPLNWDGQVPAALLFFPSSFLWCTSCPHPWDIHECGVNVRRAATYSFCSPGCTHQDGSACAHCAVRSCPLACGRLCHSDPMTIAVTIPDP